MLYIASNLCSGLSLQSPSPRVATPPSVRSIPWWCRIWQEKGIFPYARVFSNDPFQRLVQAPVSLLLKDKLHTYIFSYCTRLRLILIKEVYFWIQMIKITKLSQAVSSEVLNKKYMYLLMNLDRSIEGYFPLLSQYRYRLEGVCFSPFVKFMPCKYRVQIIQFILEQYDTRLHHTNPYQESTRAYRNVWGVQLSCIKINI